MSSLEVDEREIACCEFNHERVNRHCAVRKFEGGRGDVSSGQKVGQYSGAR